MELLHWVSALEEQPKDKERVLVQYKTFEFEEIKYNTKKKDWFIMNVQCWLSKINVKSITV